VKELVSEPIPNLRKQQQVPLLVLSLEELFFRAGGTYNNCFIHSSRHRHLEFQRTTVARAFEQVRWSLLFDNFRGGLRYLCRRSHILW
jgi:hypothetical protein